MKREVAEQISQMTRKIDDMFDALYSVFDKIDDDVEKNRFKRSLIELFRDMYEKITREAVKEFPEFHPDREYFERKNRRDR